MELTCSYNNYTVFLVISAAPWLMKVSIPESFKQTLKGMPTKVKGSIKNKSSVDILLESENNSCTQARKLHLQQFYLSDPSFGLQGRPAQKSHHTRKVGEEKCSVQNGEKGEV